MPGTVEKKLADLGITLGTPAAPVANYVGFVRTGNLQVSLDRKAAVDRGPEGRHGVLDHAGCIGVQAAMRDRPRGQPIESGHKCLFVLCMILYENRCPPRIKSGACFVGIMH